MEENNSNEKNAPTEEEKPGSFPAESDPVNIPSSSSRQKESAEHSFQSDGSFGQQLSPQDGDAKRQKTARVPSPSLVSASPPGFVTLEEIMKAANSVSKMSLAHEIAVDEDFHLEKVDPPANSLHQKVKEMAHQAFWDLLKEELEQSPPDFSRALTLLEEIREWLLSLLLPHQTRTQQEIKDKIDLEIIKQQIKEGSQDVLQNYSQYIISLMARLCSPGRDEKIRELMALRDPVPLYRGIFETLELMRIDMANFTIRMSRPHIAANCVEYERAKFEDYLKITPDGLRNTREWLHRNYLAADISSESASAIDVPRVILTVLIESFMELLKWDSKNPWPETVALDEQRFSELRTKLSSIELASSVLLVTLSCDGVGPLQSSVEFKLALKEHISVIIDGSTSLEADIERVMPNVAIQALEDVSKALVKQGLSTDKMGPDDSIGRMIIAQITDLSNKESRVRKIIHSRLMEFLRQVISNEVARPTQIPAGLSLFKPEIAGVAGRFARLVSHNRSVFAQHYSDLIQKNCLGLP